MNDSEEVQRLIRLKRYESPGEVYFASFLDSVKERQRAELLHRSARGLLWERITTWLDESGGARVFVPAGAVAAAAVGAGLYFATASTEQPAAESFAATPAAGPSAPAVEESAIAADVIRLKLPKPALRVPGGKSVFDGLLPASARGGLREF